MILLRFPGSGVAARPILEVATRCGGSHRDPDIGSAPQIGAGRTEHRPNPRFERPCAGQDPSDRTSGRPRTRHPCERATPRHAQGRWIPRCPPLRDIAHGPEGEWPRVSGGPGRKANRVMHWNSNHSATSDRSGSEGPVRCWPACLARLMIHPESRARRGSLRGGALRGIFLWSLSREFRWERRGRSRRSDLDSSSASLSGFDFGRAAYLGGPDPVQRIWSGPPKPVSRPTSAPGHRDMRSESG